MTEHHSTGENGWREEREMNEHELTIECLMDEAAEAIAKARVTEELCDRLVYTRTHPKDGADWLVAGKRLRHIEDLLVHCMRRFNTALDAIEYLDYCTCPEA